MIAIGHTVLALLGGFVGYLLNADRVNAFGILLLIALPIGGVYFLDWWALLTFSVAALLGSRIYHSAATDGRINRKDEQPHSIWDVLQENPVFQQNKALFEAMSAMCEDGVDADELPNGVGEFGLTASNPIPCRTTFGSTAYLSSLRTFDDTKVDYQRIGSVTSEVSPHPIDVYEISRPAGKTLATIYISPYQKRVSSRAPRGFKLAHAATGPFNGHREAVGTHAYDRGTLVHQEVGEVLDKVNAYLAHFGDKKPESITLNPYEWAVMDLCLRQATSNTATLHTHTHNDVIIRCKAGRCYCHNFLSRSLVSVAKAISHHLATTGNDAPDELPIDAESRNALNAHFRYFFDGAFDLDSKPRLALHVLRVTTLEFQKAQEA